MRAKRSTARRCHQRSTEQEGMEYAWFNNVEIKPGIGYPKQWENQETWNGGWIRKESGKIVRRVRPAT